MPFRSEAQRRYMWAKHPEIAERWTEEYGSSPEPKKDERNEHFRKGHEDGSHR